MTGATTRALKTIQLEGVVDLAGVAGPCITILLPPYRPGEQTKSMASLLKTYCQESERQLAAQKIDGSLAAELIEPLLRLAESPEFTGGSHWGCAIFRSQEVFARLNGIGSVRPGLTVGACFHLRPVLADLHLPAEFYLLKLSQKQVDLWRCAGLQAEPVDLPKGVPRTLEESLEFKPPDHDLENRSPAGSSAGAMRGIRFGTGSGRETVRVHVADFFKAVDRGIRELIQRKAAPLILSGVDEDTVIYQSISEYPYLLEDSIHGSASMPVPQDELLRQSHSIIRADCTQRAAASLVEMRERMAPARFLTDLDAILRAAVDGRVGWLYINEDAQVFGVFDGVRRGGRLNWGEEDLLNVAALETLLQRGLVYALPDAKMPDGVAVAAGLRY